MSMLRAVVSGKDGIVHELVLRRRANNAGYSWFYGDAALVVTPARTEEEAVQNLKRELGPRLESTLQSIAITKAPDE